MPPSGSSICLIGMMGSGKSTVGPLLAEQLGRPFIDMDQRIETEEGRSISAIFAAQGESYFRALEHALLARILGENVIVCGGGIVTQSQCRTILGEQSTIYLRAKLETLEERLRGDLTRPLLPAHMSRSDELRWLLDQRRQSYEETAKWIVDVDELSPGKIVAAIINQMESAQA
jgi:shikimate kinase